MFIDVCMWTGLFNLDFRYLIGLNSFRWIPDAMFRYVFCACKLTATKKMEKKKKNEMLQKKTNGEKGVL